MDRFRSVDSDHEARPEMFKEYEVTYANGVVQRKRMVPARAWRDTYLPARNLLARCKGAKVKPDGCTPEAVAAAELTLKELPEHFFVEDSPLGAAVAPFNFRSADGVMLLPPAQGGEHPVSMRLLGVEWSMPEPGGRDTDLLKP